MIKGNYKPLSAKVNIKVIAPNGQAIYREKVETNDFGSIQGRIKLTTNARLGYYQIQVKYKERTFYSGFYVEQYKKPVFRITINSKVKNYLQDQKINFNIKAAYYAGAPLSNQKVVYDIERKRVSFPWYMGFEYEWYYSHSNYDYNSYTSVAHGKSKTNKNGQLSISHFPSFKENQSNYDYVYRIKAKIIGQIGSEVEGSASVNVTRGNFSVRHTQKKWYYEADQPIDLTISLLYHKSIKNNIEPVKVSSRIYYREYDYKKYRYKNKKLISKIKSIITQNNQITIKFLGVKKEGSYLIETRILDADDNMLKDQTTFNVYSPWGNSNKSQKSLTLNFDKKRYTLNDIPKLKVKLPVAFPYLTVIYHHDNILSYQLIKNDKRSLNHNIKLQSEYAPNLYISVHAFDSSGKHPASYSATKELILPPKDKFLNVSLSTAKDEYRPGEKITLNIKTLNNDGKGVASEFSLGVVDEAIYAIRSDTLPSISKAIHKRYYNSLQSNNSLNFKFYGYGKEYELYASANKNDYRFIGLMKGREPEQVKVRKNFKDTAYWLAQGKTNSNGVAHIEVTMPDNLTEWRFTSHAHTPVGQTGTGISSVKTNKKVQIRLSLPRFIKEKDVIKVYALVQNRTKKKISGDFKITLKKLNAIKFKANYNKKLTLKPNSSKKVYFTIQYNGTESKDKEYATISTSYDARQSGDSKLSDAVEKKLSILATGIQTHSSHKWIMTNRKTLDTQVQKPKHARSAQLTISYINGVLPAIIETLPYLINYPYGCVEQTMSNFLPLLQAKVLAKDLGLKLEVSEKIVQKYTKIGLNKLIQFQNSNGGWGWWNEAQSNGYMTAYVLYGLYHADLAGAKVEKSTLKLGIEELARLIKKKQDLDTSIFQQYVYLLYKKHKIDKSVLDIKNWKQKVASNQLNAYQLSLVALAALELNDDNLKVEAIKRLMLNYTLKSNQGLSFKSPKTKYSWQDDTEEVTSFALAALIKTNEYKQYSNETSQIIEWILNQKKNQRWRSTKVSALMVSSLGAYARVKNEKLANTTINLKVNGQNYRKLIDYRKLDINDFTIQIENPRKVNKLSLSRSSDGLFLVKANWKYYIDQSKLKKRKRDFNLQRSFFKINNKVINNKMVYLSNKKPSTKFKIGDLVLVKTKITSPKRAKYVLIENFFPAGFEYKKQDLNIIQGNKTWYTYQSAYGSQVLDDRVALNRSSLYRTKNTFVSLFRVTHAGSFDASPASAGSMYHINSFNYSKKQRINIRP